MPLLILLLLFVIIVIYFVFRSDSADNDVQRKEYGDRGEQITGNILVGGLPRGYTVIRNLEVTYDGKTSEIDYVVVGKTGVFIIEVKSMKGTIVGDCSDYNWIQCKTDQYGNDFEKQFYNPVKQVGTHVYRLANYLRDNNVRTDIKSAVYFSEPKTKYRITGVTEKCPVFTHRTTSDMIDYITHATEDLSESTVEKIIALLTEDE